MAKIKTPAESVRNAIENALLPTNEQPHKIPSNWCWTTVGEVCSFIGGGTPDKSKPEYWNGDIPWASVKDVKGDYLFSTIDHISEEGLANSAANLCEINDLILITRIEPAKTIISNICTAINQDLKIVKSILPVEYLHFYFENYKHLFEEKSSGSTVKGITIPNIRNTCFPLPPLSEQHRIVDSIKSIFAKLDEAMEKAQAVVDGYELRKSAILHKAFSGELTAQWRSQNKLSQPEWDDTTLKKIVSGFKYGSSEKSNYTNTGVPVLRIPNIAEGYIDFEDIKFLERTAVEDSIKLQENDILIIRSNGSRDLVGKCAIVPKLEKEYAYASFLIRIKPSERILPEFLVLYLNSSMARAQLFSKAKSSAGINNINSQELGAITISVPHISEQKEIIDIVNNLLANEKQAKETAEAVLDQIDTMKKAVLARAFHGELGTNDPTEPSAIELLKSII